MSKAEWETMCEHFGADPKRGLGIDIFRKVYHEFCETGGEENNGAASPGGRQGNGAASLGAEEPAEPEEEPDEPEEEPDEPPPLGADVRGGATSGCIGARRGLTHTH